MAVWMAATPASAQSNLDAGKSPAQIFASTCNACHRSPREIKRTTPAFMREHYTTGMQEAAAMAAYLTSVGTDPKAVEQRRKPTLGAGKEPPPGSEQAKSADAGAKPQNGRSRRPSESFEAGTTLAAATTPVEQSAPPPAEAPPPVPFEE